MCMLTPTFKGLNLVEPTATKQHAKKVRTAQGLHTGVIILPYISTFKVNRELDYNLLALTCHFAWFVATI